MTAMRATGSVVRRSGQAALTLVAVLGALSILATIAAIAFHLRPVVIRSGSMSPGIPTGSIVVAHRVPASSLHVGDVVTVPVAGTHVTHRIATLTRHGDVATVRLKGDANAQPDNELHRVTTAYRMWFSVPRAGYVVSWLSRSPGIFVLAAFVALLLVVAFRAPPGRRDRPPRPHRGHRAAAVLAVVLLSGSVVGGTARPTWAAWGDGVTVTGTSLTAFTVPPPASFNCGALGLLSVTFNWTAVPGATNYTLHFGSGGASTRTVTGTSATVTSALSNGTAWVDTNVNYGATTWTSVNSNTRTYSVAVVSLCS